MVWSPLDEHADSGGRGRLLLLLLGQSPSLHVDNDKAIDEEDDDDGILAGEEHVGVADHVVLEDEEETEDQEGKIL